MHGGLLLRCAVLLAGVGRDPFVLVHVGVGRSLRHRLGADVLEVREAGLVRFGMRVSLGGRCFAVAVVHGREASRVGVAIPLHAFAPGLHRGRDHACGAGARGDPDCAVTPVPPRATGPRCAFLERATHTGRSRRLRMPEVSRDIVVSAPLRFVYDAWTQF